MDMYAIEIRKRAYSGDSSDDSCKNTTFISSYWTEASSHNDSISTQHPQQKRRLYREISPAHPSISVWNTTFQNGPETSPGLVTSSPGRPSRASASSSEPSPRSASFKTLHDGSTLSPTSRNSSIPLGHMMSDGRSSQPRAGANYPTAPGSNDSGLRGFCDDSHAASQSGVVDLMFGAPDLSYTFTSEALSDCGPTEGLGLDMMNYHEPLLTQGQDGQYPGIWPQQEIDLPWSHINTSYSHAAILSQQPRTPWSDEVLEDPASTFLGQQPNSSSIYPYHMSSPLSNGSWHPREMVLLTSKLQLPDTFPGYAQGSVLDEDGVFCEHQGLTGVPVQDGSERENSQFQPLLYNMQSSASNTPWASVDMSRSFQSAGEDFTLTNWPAPLNEKLAENVSQIINSFPSNSQPVPQGVAVQFRSMAQEATRATLKDRKWEHMIVSDGSVQQLPNQSMFKSAKKKKGRRKGALPADAARKAREVRHNRACWRCWLLHLSCSIDGICDKCQSPSPFRICNKAHLYDYTNLFFPELIVARRQPSAIQHLIKENISGFTANRIQVHLSSGPSYPPITLTVCEFVPTNDEFLFLHWAPPELNSPMPKLERIYAPPLGLCDNKDDIRLREGCQDHIKSLIKHTEFSRDATNGDAAPLAWEVYEAVNRYKKSRRMLGDAELIRKATKLHAIHFVMSRVISFTPESAQKVVQSIRSPMQRPYKYNVSSKLLNYQIKRELNMLQQELTSEVLEKLQTELRRRSKASWATSLCVILILSMCMEAVQIAIDGFIVQKILESNGTSRLPMSRDDGIHIARRLDNRPFKDCMDIFHMIYRSGESRTGTSKGEFNPIRDGIELDKAQGIDEDTVQLVDGIRRIMDKYHDEIEEKAQNPRLDSSGDVLADHYRFRRENSGRLVAKFLKSFQEAS